MQLVNSKGSLIEINVRCCKTGQKLHSRALQSVVKEKDPGPQVNSSLQVATQADRVVNKALGLHQSGN